MEDKLEETPLERYEKRLKELLAQHGIVDKQAYNFIVDSIEERQALINSAVREAEHNTRMKYDERYRRAEGVRQARKWEAELKEQSNVE